MKKKTRKIICRINLTKFKEKVSGDLKYVPLLRYSQHSFLTVSKEMDVFYIPLPYFMLIHSTTLVINCRDNVYPHRHLSRVDCFCLKRKCQKWWRRVWRSFSFLYLLTTWSQEQRTGVLHIGINNLICLSCILRFTISFPIFFISLQKDK